MISGKILTKLSEQKTMSVSTVCLVLVLLLIHPGQASSGSDDGMEWLNTMKSGLTDDNRFAFEETRFRQGADDELFTQPLRYRGWLEFDTDTNVLKKEIVSPAATRMILGVDFAEIHRGKKIRKLPQRALDRVQPLFLAFRALLLGQPDTLREHFDLKEESTQNGWRVLLTPKHKSLGKYLRQLQLDGTGSLLMSIETHHVGGDRDVMHRLSLDEVTR